ncbi:hypothetical protein M6D81_13875 [Paenibacillus sp. J5C_2022]|uniref:hypothetical protein n=1 Tax=Paenibacillus sp. J5C2022 TaxID=2977129 RepID=UPI0021D1D2AD|nr:hypothetical protein [Paenibacillus sp. J5C2022]MCU6709781.1 hypothetical protein [Paenibacillus sp. J5C2022]
MTILKAKEFMQKAHEITGDSAGQLLSIKKQFEERNRAIEDDRRLSTEGRVEAKAALKKEVGISILQNSHTRMQEYKSHLSKAAKYADAIVYAKPPKPDAVKLERFEGELRRLKTELQIATRADAAYKKLTEFVEKLDDPYIANIVSDQFGEMAATIIGAPGSDGHTRQNLSQTFGTLQTKFETDDVRQARTIMESAQSMLEQPEVYTGPIITDAVDNMAGPEYTRYLNRTDEFFVIEGNEGHRPEDYKEEEVEVGEDPNSPEALAREVTRARYAWDFANHAILIEQAAQEKAKVAYLEERLQRLQEGQ